MMSSKKKLVLGIAHLSIAMLGASLLVANPVSADGRTSNPDYKTGFTEGESAGYHEGFYPYDYSLYQSPSKTRPGNEDYAKGYNDGFQQGYSKGKEKYTNQSIFAKAWYLLTCLFVTR
ncbi:UNVERIFIED_CONTAM: hypothetical protein KB579_03855 [Streptococcus canis]|uniref:hypothetical protein n=1 Tax=Streptococcus canis TaxID=1329 RepID=UPI0024DE80AE|nr:hypothetical protein [Streptococcus canis]